MRFEMAREGGNRTTCMNASCGAAEAAGEWKKGWALRSGGFANLCGNCGLAYEQLTFCDMFHLKESGWRECNSCGKRLHCGCIVSKHSVELLDSGGVQCISCTKNSELCSIPRDAHDSLSEPAHMVLSLSAQNPKYEKTNDFGASTLGNTCNLEFASTGDNKGHHIILKGNPMHTGKNIGDNVQNCVFYSQIDGTNGSAGNIKREQVTLSVGNAITHKFSNKNRLPIMTSQALSAGNTRDYSYNKGMHESITQESPSTSLGTSNPGNMVEACYVTGSHFGLPLPNVVAEGRDQSKALSALQQAQRARHLLPKPPKTGLGLETSKEMLSHMRVARPPAEGRGRSQLLPRYWPRITDQELQQISGDSNSTIVPLFEKVLSASDAGRIGRLVLPKACAEAYFPPISQPEGLPLKIQDAKGKDWVFQFRFWPNNNSRMYVLEGVTPCIQSMQLQAGDTVTFSRIDPERKLVMGFRKATNSVPLQDSQISAIANGALVSESLLSGVIENLPIVSGYRGLFQSLKGSTDHHLSALSELNLSDRDICWPDTDKHQMRQIKGLPLQPLLVPEKKRSRNIGSKSKRLLIDTEDAMELRLTWEEVQDLLRPPPSSKPSIVIIEDHEFEEYDEPPVFGKRTFFTSQSSGCNDQWVQCDNCCKWRRLPVDVLLPSKWTCTDNTWDPKRSFCSAPDEMSQKELQDLLHLNADFRKRRSVASCKEAPLEQEASALDTLATAATLGDDMNAIMPSVATTTKHPRHRAGCTCIVCIQPPSGKGPKHMPTCTCNVCLTVKRRFHTLMMRKKKRQSEREEAEIHKKLAGPNKDDMEADSSLKGLLDLDMTSQTDLDSGYGRTITENPELDKGHLDLNCHPEREENLQAGPTHISMMSLLQVASLPLETYLKQNGLTSLVCEQQASSSSHALQQAPADSEGRTVDESYLASVARERDSAVDEGNCGSDQAQNDPV